MPPKAKAKGKGKSRNNRLPRPRTLLQRVKALSVGDAAEALFGAYSAVGSLVGMNEEVKFIDTSIAPAIVTNAGAIQPLSLMAEGDTVSQRAGESIRAHGIEINYLVGGNNTALNNTARYVLLQDAESRGAAPAATDVFEVTGVANGVLSPWNHLGAPRFNILWDSGPICVGIEQNFQRGGREVIMLKDHIHYSGAGGTIAQQFEGGLFMAMITDQAVNGATMAFYSRFHFVDN